MSCFCTTGDNSSTSVQRRCRRTPSGSLVVVPAGDLQVVDLDVNRVGVASHHAQNQDGPRPIPVVLGATMHGQSGTCRHVATPREAPAGQGTVAPGLFWAREHAVLEGRPVVELCARRDPNGARSSVTSTVVMLNASEVSRRSWRFLGDTEVAVPGLVLRARKWHVEPQLNDQVIRPQHLRAQPADRRMGDQVDEPADLLGVHREVVPLRTAADGAIGIATGVGEGRLEVLVQRVGPGRRRSSPAYRRCRPDRERPPARRCSIECVLECGSAALSWS